MQDSMDHLSVNLVAQIVLQDKFVMQLVELVLHVLTDSILQDVRSFVILNVIHVIKQLEFVLLVQILCGPFLIVMDLLEEYKRNGRILLLRIRLYS